MVTLHRDGRLTRGLPLFEGAGAVGVESLGPLLTLHHRRDADPLFVGLGVPGTLTGDDTAATVDTGFDVGEDAGVLAGAHDALPHYFFVT